jgi:predicted RNA polymerase sigma factor
VTTDREVEDLLRRLAPQVLGILMRRYGDFDACEDAVQEALVAAAAQWRADGLPDNPRAWLLTVASRRLTDEYRSEAARRRREQATALAQPADQQVIPGPDADLKPDPTTRSTCS